MGSFSLTNPLNSMQLSGVRSYPSKHCQPSCIYVAHRHCDGRRALPLGRHLSSRRNSRFVACAAMRAGITNSAPSKDSAYTVGDFMTKKEELHVVKTTTTVDEALELLVEKRVTGFPVIDDVWNLDTHSGSKLILEVGVVSDYDLLALDSISGGGGQSDASIFPDVDCSWKAFNRVQQLLSKTQGKVVGDLMTTAPLVVRESTNLEDAARLLLETKYRRLPVVDSNGKLVGIITRGNVVRAALLIKRANERSS